MRIEISPDNDEDLSRSVIAQPRARGPSATPHNTKGVRVHALFLKTLTIYFATGWCTSSCRQRVIQLGKSATTSVARGPMRVETNRELRELNRTKGQQSGGPSARAMLAQKGTGVLTHEPEGELKRKAEVRVVAEKEKSERLGKSDRRKLLMKRC